MLLLESQRRVFGKLKKQILTSAPEPTRVLLRGPSGCGKSWLIRRLIQLWPEAAVIAAGEPALARRAYGAFWLGISTTGPRLSFRKTVIQGASAAGRTVPVVGSLVSYLTELLTTNRTRLRRDQALYLKSDEFDILTHLDAISRSRNLLLVADDLQYWDQDSLQLLYLIISKRLDEVFPILEKLSILATLADGSDNESHSPLPEVLALLPEPIRLESITVDEVPTALRMFGLSEVPNRAQLEMLYVLSGGHLELLRQVAEYLHFNPAFPDVADLLRSANSSVEQFLSTILVHRLHSEGAAGRSALKALEAAAVIGKTFTMEEFRCLLKPSGMDSERCLDAAQQLGLLARWDRTLTFRHEILRNCLILHGNERVSVNRRAFADCLSLLRPFDYFTRAEHLLAAGAIDDAARLYFSGLYKRIRDGQPVPEEFRAEVKEMLRLTGQSQGAEVILNAYDAITDRQFDLAIKGLDACENTDHPMFVAERYLLRGLAQLQSVITSERRSALATLQSCASIDHGEKELEIRVKLTLLTAYVHLEEWVEARKLDQKISATLSALQRTDSGAREGLEIHRRKSGMLYGSEVAAERCRHAATYFGPQTEVGWPPRNPIQFFMAQCNLAGNLIVAGNFSEAARAAHIGLETWSRLQSIRMPRVEKCINNSVVASVLGEKLEAGEAVTLLEELRAQNSGGVFSRLIRNNCAVFRALSSDPSGALTELQDLAGDLRRENIEDAFYIYFIETNLAGLLHVLGNSEEGRARWKELSSLVPVIPDSDRHYLIARHELQARAFEEVAPGNAQDWNNYLNLHWPNHLGPGWRFYGRGFLVTDTQIWLES